MGTNQRFHQSNKYFLEHSSGLLLKAVEGGKITEEEKNIISEYIEELNATSKISATRRYKLVGTIIRNHAYHPEFSKCTISDVYKAVNTIETETLPGSDAPRYKVNTISDMVRMIKRIFIWLAENGYSNIDLRKLQKIKVPRSNLATINADMLLSENEVLKMIEVCNNTRDRALISVLYEGGFRIGEVANLTWGDVSFTDWNVTARTSEKTGKPRFVPLVSSRGYLSQWKNDYPLPITPDAFVFLTATTKKPLQYAGLTKQIRKIAVRAGITKYIKPHLFRHSRITHLSQKGMNEATIKLMMWGDTSTDMMKVYQHLTDNDVLNSVAEVNGIVPPEKQTGAGERSIKPVQCPRCATINSQLSKYCSECGEPLIESEKDSVTALQDTVKQSIYNDPTLLAEVFNLMKQAEQERLKHS